MTLTVELTEEQLRTLQRAQYRNGEKLAHTLLRLAKLVPDPKPEAIPVYDLLPETRMRQEIMQQEDARILAFLLELTGEGEP